MSVALEPTLLGAPPPPLGRDRATHVYLAAATLSQVGDAVFVIALAWTAVHELPPALAGLVVGLETLPQAACTLAGGVLADRLDTRRVMLLGYLGRLLVLLGGAAAWEAGVSRVAVMVAVALSFGVLAGLTQPAGGTLVRQLVRTEDLGTVAGWQQIAYRIARMGGAALGVLVVTQLGLAGAMLADALTFLVLGLVVAGVVRLRFHIDKGTSERWRDTFAGGLRYLRGHPAARTFVLGLCGLNVFVSPVIAVGIPLQVREQGWSSGWVGGAEVALGVGALLGAVAGIRWQGEFQARRAFLLLVVQGLAYAVTGLPAPVLLLLGMALIGATAGIASVWLTAAFQRAIAPAQLGRIGSMTSLGDQALIPLSLPAFGALAAAGSVTLACTAYGVGMVALCLWCASRPAIRALR